PNPPFSDLQKGGKEYRRLVAAFERIFGATMFFGTETATPKARVVQRSRFNFLREARIWYNREPDQQAISDEFENVIVLSEEFYTEVTAHPVPTDLEAVKVLIASPGLLDLFMWLGSRRFVAKGEESIPIFGPYGVVAQIGTVEYTRPRRLRARLEKWLDTIRMMWPECPGPKGRGFPRRQAAGIARSCEATAGGESIDGCLQKRKGVVG